MDEIDAVIEDIAPVGRGDGAAGELAVDRIQHHEDQADGHALPVVPSQNSQVAITHSNAPIAVTMFGVTPARAARRVNHSAHSGHRYLVSRSVTPL